MTTARARSGYHAAEYSSFGRKGLVQMAESLLYSGACWPRRSSRASLSCRSPAQSSRCRAGSRTRTTRSRRRRGRVRRAGRGQDTSLLAIDRENEVHNTIAAAEVGVGARVVAYLPEHGAARARVHRGTHAVGRGPAPRRQAGPRCRGCRRAARRARFRDDFNMFEIQRGYLEIVQERGLSPARPLPRVRAPGASDRGSDARSRRGHRARATTTCWPRTSSTSATASG